MDAARSVRAGMYAATGGLLDESAAETIRAGLYERVSRLATPADRVKARSIEQQNGENREACTRYGWTVADIYPDPGLSASRFAKSKGGANREQYRRMVADLESGRLDVLILWEPSRGSRELEGWAALLNAARRTGTKIHITSHDRTYDLANARDWRSLAEDGIDSHYEAEKISARIKRGKAASRAAGRPQGKAPYGVRRIYDERTRDWLRDEPEPGTSPFVLEIKTRGAAGESYTDVMADLNARGIPSPAGGTWTLPSVTRIANSRSYVNTEIVPDPIEEKVQARAADASRSGERPGSQRFRYTGVMKCSVCGGYVRMQKRDTLRYYGCVRGCAYVDVAAADLFIDEVAIERLSRGDAVTFFTRDDNEAAAAEEAEAARCRHKIAEATASYNDDRITLKTLETVTAKFLPKAQAAEKRAAALRLPSALVGLYGTDRDEVAARWQALTISARKAAIRALMPDLELRPPKQRHTASDEALSLRIIPWPEKG